MSKYEHTNYDWKNLWPKKKDNTVVWLSVVSKYKHYQSHFNLRKFLLGFFILQKPWDPNFLLVCISFLLCTTVPFFLVVIFPVICKYHNWCLCQNTNTITTQKNYDPKKKGTVIWPAMFFKPPEKNYDKKKKVQSSDQRLK